MPCTSVAAVALQVCNLKRSVPKVASSKPPSDHRAAAALRKSRDNKAANKVNLVISKRCAVTCLTVSHLLPLGTGGCSYVRS